MARTHLPTTRLQLGCKELIRVSTHCLRLDINSCLAFIPPSRATARHKPSHKLDKHMKKHEYKAAESVKKTLPIESLETLTTLLRELSETARESYDLKSEKWQESGSGAEELERVESLESALESLESAFESLESAFESLESIEENAPEGSYM